MMGFGKYWGAGWGGTWNRLGGWVLSLLVLRGWVEGP